ncbi:hypothetical protein [Alteromonas facilis]|uniref:hypothetical protein n=1 Tax=Alteromonas facilis TaxID=2048004 RepID=UPI000C2862B9|nr:hypothetical protein [Alteromonas facilis]
MRTLLIIVLVVWSVSYVTDISWFDNMHFHTDFSDNLMSVGEWFFGTLVIAAVFLILAAILATGFLMLFFVGVIGAVAFFAALGLSILWPVAIAIGLYFICRDNQHTVA